MNDLNQGSSLVRGPADVVAEIYKRISGDETSPMYACSEAHILEFEFRLVFGSYCLISFRDINHYLVVPGSPLIHETLGGKPHLIAHNGAMQV